MARWVLLLYSLLIVGHHGDADEKVGIMHWSPGGPEFSHAAQHQS